MSHIPAPPWLLLFLHVTLNAGKKWMKETRSIKLNCCDFICTYSGMAHFRTCIAIFNEKSETPKKTSKCGNTTLSNIARWPDVKHPGFRSNPCHVLYCDDYFMISLMACSNEGLFSNFHQRPRSNRLLLSHEQTASFMRRCQSTSWLAYCLKAILNDIRRLPYTAGLGFRWRGCWLCTYLVFVLLRGSLGPF